MKRCFSDPGGDLWSANPFHTRDVLRQTVIDYAQAVRVFRSFGSATMPTE